MDVLIHINGHSAGQAIYHLGKMIIEMAAAVFFFEPFQCAEDLTMKVYLTQVCEVTGSQEKKNEKRLRSMSK